MDDARPSDKDEIYIRMAIEQAKKSRPEDAVPHPKVGVVVVKGGTILAQAHRGEFLSSEINTLGNHAEFIALEKLLPGQTLAGATVYTTLEPCTTRNHPKIPCATRLIDRKVKRVVIGMIDPNKTIQGNGIRRLRDANIEVALFWGDFVDEVEELNREFRRYVEAIAPVATGRIGSSEPKSFYLPRVPLGRDADRGEAAKLLRDNRVLLLHGAPGQGKTALAQYIAWSLEAEFADGVVQLDLRSERQVENLGKLVAVELGYPDSGNAFELLRSRSVLLLLDSFEAIVRSSPPDKVRRVLQVLLEELTGGSRAIITSRDKLQLDGIVPMPVRPLQPAAALELFHSESDGIYNVADEARISEFVSGSLGGHALSIRIVARYSLAAKLDFDDLSDLWLRKWTAIGRFRPGLLEDTLEASFELSYATLTADEKHYFLVMSLLPDGIASRDLRAIWGERDSIAIEALSSLEQRSLIESEGLRWRLPGPLFLFAQEKRRTVEAVECGERSALQNDTRRIDEFVDRFIRDNAPQASDDDPREKNRRIREAFYNVHACFDRRLEPSTKPSSLLAAESVLQLYWAYHNNLSGYKNPIASAEDAVQYLDKASRIFQINGDEEKQIRCKFCIGNILWLRGDPAKARPYLQDVLNSPAASTSMKANCKRSFAHVEYKLGKIPVAARYYEEVAEEARENDDVETSLKCQTGLIDAFRKMEHYDEAKRCFASVEPELPGMPLSISGNILRGYAFVLLLTDDLAEARTLYEQAAEIFANVSAFGQAHCRRGLGDVFVALRDFSRAEEQFAAAMRLYDEANKNPSLGVGLVSLGRGRSALEQGEIDGALSHFREAAALFDRQRLDEPFELGQAYEQMACAFLRTSAIEDALGNFELALSQYELTGCERPAARVRRIIADLRRE